MTIGPARRVTHDATFCMKKNLCWSPDGKQIGFSREYGIEYSICAVNPDGSGFRQISESTPDKSPKIDKECLFSNHCHPTPACCKSGKLSRKLPGR